MPSSGIINLAAGLILVFGATSALTATATEAVARFLGLRGAFLLRGLGELLDGSQASSDLGPVKESYLRVRGLITGQRAATDARAAADAEPDNKQLQDAALAAEAAQAKLNGMPGQYTGTAVSRVTARAAGWLGNRLRLLRT